MREGKVRADRVKDQGKRKYQLRADRLIRRDPIDSGWVVVKVVPV